VIPPVAFSLLLEDYMYIHFVTFLYSKMQ